MASLSFRVCRRLQVAAGALLGVVRRVKEEQQTGRGVVLVHIYDAI
jgi:hypothetical protein